MVALIPLTFIQFKRVNPTTPLLIHVDSRMICLSSQLTPTHNHFFPQYTSFSIPSSWTFRERSHSMAESIVSEDITMVVDPSGDVILVVGSTPHSKNVQVSSHVLSLASTVFKAMFSPHFQEGQRIMASSGTSVTISLPDDDPEAACLACEILHHKTDNTMENPNVELLAKLATFAEKYHCARSLRPSTHCWIQKLQSGTKPAGYKDFLVVSYLFDDPHLFHKLTRDMALDHSGSFLQLLSEHGQEILPATFASKCISALSVSSPK